MSVRASIRVQIQHDRQIMWLGLHETTLPALPDSGALEHWLSQWATQRASVVSGTVLEAEAYDLDTDDEVTVRWVAP